MSVGLWYKGNAFQGIPLPPHLTRTPFHHLMNPLHYNGIINIKNLYFFQCYHWKKELCWYKGIFTTVAPQWHILCLFHHSGNTTFLFGSVVPLWCHCDATSCNQNNPCISSPNSIQWINIMVCITHAILHHWIEFGELIFILIPRSKQKENLIQNVWSKGNCINTILFSCDAIIIVCNIMHLLFSSPNIPEIVCI